MAKPDKKSTKKKPVQTAVTGPKCSHGYKKGYCPTCNPDKFKDTIVTG